MDQDKKRAESFSALYFALVCPPHLLFFMLVSFVPPLHTSAHFFPRPITAQFVCGYVFSCHARYFHAGHGSSTVFFFGLITTALLKNSPILPTMDPPFFFSVSKTVIALQYSSHPLVSFPLNDPDITVWRLTLRAHRSAIYANFRINSGTYGQEV